MRFGLRHLCLLLATVVFCLLLSSSWAWAAPRSLEASLEKPIPIQEQPFYPDLLIKAEQWSYAPLGQIRGDSPRETLLNFYAAMANVGKTTHNIAESSQSDPGLGWSTDMQEKISRAEALFENCVDSLDTTAFPPSVRRAMSEEAAIELKHVLDYVFNNARNKITIPDKELMQEIIRSRPNRNESWRLPGTTIILSTIEEAGNIENGVEYYFAKSTVKKVRNKFERIYPKSIQKSDNNFATPFFYSDYIYNPGYLIPPKWYLNLPEAVLNLKNIRLGEQTIFQSTLALGSLITYSIIAAYLINKVLKTYAFGLEKSRKKTNVWEEDSLAWQRFLLLLPLLPITKGVEIFIEEYVNLTGQFLFYKIYIFYILWFGMAGVVAFYFFEAIGRSLTEFIASVSDRKSEISLKRIGNLLMPSCRALGVLSAIALIYRAFIMLGLPTSTILAFSAVPGLAIGLGASKLLGNIFAGFSIQVDRPLRVGEFCKVGKTLGYVTKIGLRSMELQTPESKVSIPNSVAEENTVINYSQRLSSNEHEGQAITIQLEIIELASPWQINQLINLTKKHLSKNQKISDVLVSIDHQINSIHLLFFATAKTRTWEEFLDVRQLIIIRIQQLMTQVKHSRRIISVPFETSPDKLNAVQHEIKRLVNEDEQLNFHACKLLKISEFSYDFILMFTALHDSHAEFLESIDHFNKSLINQLNVMQIQIPYPTSTFSFQRSDRDAEPFVVP